MDGDDRVERLLSGAGLGEVRIERADALRLVDVGIVVEGLRVVSAGPLFIGGNALAIWMVWAAVRLAATPAPSPRDAMAPAAWRAEGLSPGLGADAASPAHLVT